MSRKKDGVSLILSMISEEFPSRRDLGEVYHEVADYLRSQDLPQRDVERVLRLLRMKCQTWGNVSAALERWSSERG